MDELTKLNIERIWDNLLNMDERLSSAQEELEELRQLLCEEQEYSAKLSDRLTDLDIDLRQHRSTQDAHSI